MSFTFDDWKSGQPIPKGWDGADAVDDGWTRDQLNAFLKATVQPPRSPPAATPAAEPAEQPVDRPPPPERPAARPVREARTTRQEEPASAEIVSIKSRKPIRADSTWEIELVKNDEDKLKPGAMKNWALFLENHPAMAGVYAWDAFKLRVMLMRRPPWDRGAGEWTPRVLCDGDYTETCMWLETLTMTPKSSNIGNVIDTVAQHNSFDRLREYLEGLEWDGVKRVETWLSYYLGAEPTPYVKTVGTRWLISSVARGLVPGCKVDTMPILEGAQGKRKSTVLRVLYGDEFFTDELSELASKDALMELQGIWCLEVAEMHRFSASETNAVKKFLSRQTDRYRPPYGRSVIEAPRRVSIAGTINPEGNAYLKDPTGARRFWPVTIGQIDLDAIKADRDQLWAEAVRMFRDGVPWWVQEEELDAVEAEQEKRTDVDIWMNIVAPMVKGERRVTLMKVLEEIGVPKKDADHRHSARIGRIMKKLGWTSTRERSGGNDQTVFLHPGFDPASPADEAARW